MSSASSYTQCPTCGWTGERSSLDDDGGERYCPACDARVRVD